MEDCDIGYIARDIAGNILVTKDGFVTCNCEGITFSKYKYLMYMF